MYALVDGNNFYASCERVFRPDLWEKPVIVLSNNDGCVISRSDEAKALGVKMGEPFFKHERFYEKNNITVFSANFALYGDLSERVTQVLANFTPDIEVYSIDESFLGLYGFRNLDFKKYGQEIKATVFQHVGIPVGVGIAPTKTLAKLANHVAKKDKSYSGCCYLKDMAQVDRICGQIPVEEVWGIGHRWVKLLYRQKVKTVADFKALPEKWVHKQMTVIGLRTYRELHGNPCISLEDAPPAKKAILTSRSFGKPLQKLADLEAALCTFGSNAARKLRQQNCCTSLISVSLETNRFQLDMPSYKRRQAIRLPYPTDSSLIINQYACYALKQIYNEAYKYKKTGILLMDFTPKKAQQLDLFNNFNSPKHHQIMETCDALSQKYGKHIVKTAREGTKEPYKMRQERLSPCYTTRIEDILVIKI
ncbi:MAG: Y-family DNA polymerase [Bacteroidota bacterium]